MKPLVASCLHGANSTAIVSFHRSKVHSLMLVQGSMLEPSHHWHPACLVESPGKHQFHVRSAFLVPLSVVTVASVKHQRDGECLCGPSLVGPTSWLSTLQTSGRHA
jgi:hypothetical protein